MTARIPFDADTRRYLEKYVKDNFPDAECDAEGDVITAVAVGLRVNKVADPRLQPFADDLDALIREKGLDRPLPAAPVTGTFRYYNVRATHDREIPDLDAFTGRLPMARVTLPRLTKDAQDFETSIGSVRKSDHFYRSVEEFKLRYAGKAPYQSAARIDLITPPRADPFNLRFGAISVYLGYLDAAGAPSFYVLEAGTATGQPKVPFPAPSFDNGVYAYAGYTPTPFTNKQHIYKGQLEWRETGTKRLKMSVRKDAASAPYMRLNVSFEETTDPWRTWPGFLILKAALIVLDRKEQVENA